jgi:tetratricopeptide (TPR) repeat protein
LESRYGKGEKKNYPDPRGDKFYEANVGRKSPERNRYWWVLGEQMLSLYIEYHEKYNKGQIMFFHELAAEDAEPVTKDYFFYGKQGSNYRKQGKYDEAISSFTKAIELNPEGDMAYNNRGWAYYKKRQYDLAASDYTKAIEIKPRNELAYNNRGLAYLAAGLNDLAVSDLSKAVELNPTGYMIYYYRGLAYYKSGLLNKAASDYDKAIEIAPNHVVTLNQKAWMLATCPNAKYRDGAKAVELAKRAVELSPNFKILDTLAAAYAEAGRFDDAIATQEEIISILRKENKSEEVIRKLEERLMAYRNHKPWRE